MSPFINGLDVQTCWNLSPEKGRARVVRREYLVLGRMKDETVIPHYIFLPNQIKDVTPFVSPFISREKLAFSVFWGSLDFH